MRQITKDAIHAFMEGEYFSRSNTEVFCTPTSVSLYLHKTLLQEDLETVLLLYLLLAGFQIQLKRDLTVFLESLLYKETIAGF